MPDPVPPRPAPRPSAASHPTEIVGEGEAARDVGGMSDRQVAVLALDQMLRANGAMKRLADSLTLLGQRHTRLDERMATFEERRATIEVQRMTAAAFGEAGAPTADRLLSPRAPLESYDELRAPLMQAGIRLSERVRDPKDKMTSDRAKAIVSETLQKIATESAAKNYQSLLKNSRKIAWELIKALVMLLFGALGARYGLPALGARP